MRFTLRNIKLLIEYDGSRYDGWQRPAAGAKGMTVQEKLEEILCRMDGEKIEIIGAARTEAGVHASGQVANFHSDTDMSFLEIKHYLNRFLPRDIAVRSVDGVPERFHASYLAKAFRYEYHISIGEVPSVFGRTPCCAAMWRAACPQGSCVPAAARCARPPTGHSASQAPQLTHSSLITCAMVCTLLFL